MHLPPQTSAQLPQQPDTIPFPNTLLSEHPSSLQSQAAPNTDTFISSGTDLHLKDISSGSDLHLKDISSGTDLHLKDKDFPNISEKDISDMLDIDRNVITDIAKDLFEQLANDQPDTHAPLKADSLESSQNSSTMLPTDLKSPDLDSAIKIKTELESSSGATSCSEDKDLSVSERELKEWVSGIQRSQGGQRGDLSPPQTIPSRVSVHMSSKQILSSCKNQGNTYKYLSTLQKSSIVYCETKAKWPLQNLNIFKTV